MITLKSKTKDFGINIPTELSELTPQFLTRITNNITLSEHYSIVAICKHCDIAQFVLANTGNKSANALVDIIPILAKGGNNAPLGAKIFINKLELERGETIWVNTVVSDSFIYNYIDSDPELRKQVITNINKTKVYILSFKLVPNSAIHGYVTKELDITKDDFYGVEDKSMHIPFTGKDE